MSLLPLGIPHAAHTVHTGNYDLPLLQRRPAIDCSSSHAVAEKSSQRCGRILQACVKSGTGSCTFLATSCTSTSHATRLEQSVERVSCRCRTQTVQVPKHDGIEPQEPLQVWYLGANTCILGYLNRLGKIGLPPP